jgi:hypothetical protein
MAFKEREGRKGYYTVEGGRLVMQTKKTQRKDSETASVNLDIRLWGPGLNPKVQSVDWEMNRPRVQEHRVALRQR